jgi:hypothetical protein
MSLALSRLSWQQLEGESFSLVYGSIMVLSLLLALDLTSGTPFRPALVLFGSVLAMTLSRMLAALLSRGVEMRAPIMTLDAFHASWRSSRTILMVANLPALLFATAGLGWLPSDVALHLSQGFCILLLVTLGGRAGWNISGGWLHPLLGAASAGMLGCLLAAMKFAID